MSSPTKVSLARFVICLTIIVFVTAVIKLATADNTSHSFGSVLNQTEELRLKYPVFKGPEGTIWQSEMPKQLAKDEDAIATILAYTAESKNNSYALSNVLLTELDDLSNQYSARTVIDDNVAKKTLWYRDEYPGVGLPLHCYLLLEVAKQRQTNAFTVKCLKTILKAQTNISCFWKNVEIKNNPEDKERINKESPVGGDYITTASGDIAWCLDNFLKDIYNSGNYQASTQAYAVLQEYWSWRTTAIAESSSKDSLDVRNLPEIKTYINRFISTLE